MWGTSESCCDSKPLSSRVGSPTKVRAYGSWRDLLFRRSPRGRPSCWTSSTRLCVNLRWKSFQRDPVISFIDDAFRWNKVRFPRSTAKVFDKTREVIKLLETQTRRRLKGIHSDNGKEFVNKILDRYLKNKGIQRPSTIPHNPEQSRVAERKNRESARDFWEFPYPVRFPVVLEGGSKQGELFAQNISVFGHLRTSWSSIHVMSK